MPAAQVFTGLSVNTALPYAVISKESEHPGDYYNDGAATAAVASASRCFTASPTLARPSCLQVKAAFDGSDFPLAGSDKVLDMRRANDSERQSEDGVWQFLCDFQCTVYLAAGG